MARPKNKLKGEVREALEKMWPSHVIAKGVAKAERAMRATHHGVSAAHYATLASETDIVSYFNSFCKSAYDKHLAKTGQQPETAL